MNIEQHLASILKTSLNGTNITKLSRKVVHNITARTELLRLAEKSGLDITIDTPETTCDITPRSLTPIAIMDISGSMVTPENKAMLAAVVTGLEARTDHPAAYIGCHTSAYLWTLDEIMENKITGGTLLSKAFDCLKENQEHILGDSSGVLYYLTDGDNWNDDNVKFVNDLVELYDSGAINSAVIHVSTGRKGAHLNLTNAVEVASIDRSGIKVVITPNSMGKVIESAQEVLKAFSKF